MSIINKIIHIFFVIITIMFFHLTNANAKSPDSNITKMNFSFDGIFGMIDKASARRGLQVYTEVCSGCHSLEHVSYRNLSGIGF